MWILKILFAGSVAKLLFNTITVMDFLANVFFCPLLLHYMLVPYLLPVIRQGTPIEVMITIYFHVIVVSSLITSTALAICRYIRIKFPFYAIKKMRVFICCIIAIVIQLAFIISNASKNKNLKLIWIRYSVQVLFASDVEVSYLLLLVRMIILVVIVSTGIIVSILSVLELRKSSKVANCSRVNMIKSSRVIVCMNVYNAMSFLGIVIAITMKLRYPVIFFFVSICLPIIGAAFNATIRVMASKDVYKYCKSLLVSEDRHCFTNTRLMLRSYVG